MVGVPGRSKACNTCRQRRIAPQRPQCAQCVKSNRVCTGYQRERIFILNQGTVEEGQKITTKTPPSETENRTSVGRNKGDMLLSLRSKECTRAGSTRCTAPQVPLGNNVLPHVAYRQQLLNTFLCCYIPVAQLGPIEEKPWLMLLPDLPTPTRALETSTLAVCTAKLGRVNDDPVLVRESLRLYTQGLWELQKALWDPCLMYKDETLGACMALAMYELIECPAETKYGYASHHNRCARLVQLRGAEAHTSGLGHQIFLTFRIQGVLQALEHHRSTYLSDPTWTELPWKNLSKGPFDQLLDFLALAPDIFKQADGLKDLDTRSLLLATPGIVDRCWKLDAGLQRFYEELENSTLGPLYWPEFSTEDNPADDPELGKVFPVAFYFLNLRMANTVMFYWATLTMLWSGLSQLYKLIPTIQLDKRTINSSADGCCHTCSDDWSCDDICSCKDEARTFGSTQFDMSQLPPLDHRVDFVSVARNVCQSVEYCMQDVMLGLGPSSVIAPLSIVVDTLKDYPSYSRELLWAKAALDRVHRRGMRILKYFDRL